MYRAFLTFAWLNYQNTAGCKINVKTNIKIKILTCPHIWQCPQTILHQICLWLLELLQAIDVCGYKLSSHSYKHLRKVLASYLQKDRHDVRTPDYLPTADGAVTSHS